MESPVASSSVADDVVQILKVETARELAWHCQVRLWAAVTTLMVGFALFAIIFPMRALPDIEDMAALVDHAGRRVPVAQSCVYLARELMLDDGFSRMHSEHLALRLDQTLQSLQQQHLAVRLGGDLGIRVGADIRFHSHNVVMYEPGCPWRDGAEAQRRATLTCSDADQPNSSSVSAPSNTSDIDEHADEDDACFFEGRPLAASQGLHHLMLLFIDTVEAILDKYAPTGYTSYDEGGRNVSDEAFMRVAPRRERITMVQEDADMQFLLNNLEGDLYVGLNHIQDLFLEEVHHMLEIAHFENEMLFSFYALMLILGWYFVIFRSARLGTLAEVTMAKGFVSYMPLHTMASSEISCITNMFKEPDQEAETLNGPAARPV